MTVKPRRLLAAAAITAAAAMVLAGCSGTGGSSGSSGAVASKAPTHLEGTVSLWHFFTDREAKVIQSVVDDFEKKNPDVKVQVHTGQDDEKLTKAIAAGKDVDVAISFSTDIVGSFCSNGAFRDLDPYIKRDQVDVSQIPTTPRSYTEFQNKRCAMPMLSDAYGLYYNKDILKKYGYSQPPKTLSQLEDMAMKMTTFKSDGSIKTLGFNPMMGWNENSPARIGPAAGAKWLDPSGKAVIASSPGWVELMKWQKAFVDKIGYKKLNTFTSGLGQEFSANNAFQTGQVAMVLDGEWRTAFIKDQKPDLNYGTAAFPTADDHTDLYGGGYVSGNIAGIAKGSSHPELAWALLKYLSTNTDAVVKLANGLGNVPTWTPALTSPDLKLPAQFTTFLNVMQNPNSTTTPPSPVGAGYQQSLSDFWVKYQSGKATDLQAGLKDVDKQIDDAVALTKGP